MAAGTSGGRTSQAYEKLRKLIFVFLFLIYLYIKRYFVSAPVSLCVTFVCAPYTQDVSPPHAHGGHG